MIRLLVVGLVCLTSSLCYSQNFVSTDNRWVINKWYWSFTEGEQVGKNYFYWLKDEVELNNLTYLQLHTVEIGTQDITATGLYYREDDDGKVFVTNTIDEFLIYDFELEVGDSLIVSDRTSLEILTKETERFIDGSERSVFGFGTYVKMIEGIGLTNRPFYPFNEITDSGEYINCFARNGKLVYSGTNDFPCEDFYTDTDDFKTIDKIRIWQSADRINLDGIENKNASIDLFNLNGQLLQKSAVTSGYVYIDKSIPAGMILCRLITGNKLVHNQLLFIE